MLVSDALHIAIVGPLAPPAGGMAGQTRQLCDLLLGEGIDAEIVCTNPPYRPRFVERLRGIRALFRFAPYLWRLWRAAGRSSVLHVMANSGWAWHLFAAPAVWIGRLRRVRVIVNYRGGSAEAFLARSAAAVRPTLRLADGVVVPSEFLRAVFARFGIEATVVPNVVDVRRFVPAPAVAAGPGPDAPHVVIARNLEPIYDIATAIRSFAILHAARPTARLSIAGSGPERAMLGKLVEELGLTAAVVFRRPPVARRNGRSLSKRHADAEFQRRRQYAELLARGDGLRHSDRQQQRRWNPLPGPGPDDGIARATGQARSAGAGDGRSAGQSFARRPAGRKWTAGCTKLRVGRCLSAVGAAVSTERGPSD